MPNLEPAIQDQLRWENPDTQNGRKTFPIGPMKWEEGSDGEMQAWGVGSENGVQRRKLIFSIPNPVGYKKGMMPAPSIVNTPAHQIGDPLTTVGTATHPPDTGETYSDTPPSFPDSPRNSTSAESSTLPIREGTSETRYAQQSHTHADGQLANGTPEAAVNDHGHGDKTLTMEPNTVGQAPKEKPLPEPEQPPAPGYLDQAKQAAATASATVTSAAGAVVGAVTGSHEKAKEIEETPVRIKSPAEQELDAKIDSMSDKDVEALLKEKHASGRST